MRVCLENFEDIEKLKSLKENDFLYSSMIDSFEENEEFKQKVSILTYRFKEYIKSPGNQKGVWAKIEQIEIDDKGNAVPITVNFDNDKKETSFFVHDLTKGVYLSKKNALKELKDFMYGLYKLSKEAYENEK